MRRLGVLGPIESTHHVKDVHLIFVLQLVHERFADIVALEMTSEDSTCLKEDARWILYWKTNLEHVRSLWESLDACCTLGGV